MAARARHVTDVSTEVRDYAAHFGLEGEPRAAGEAVNPAHKVAGTPPQAAARLRKARQYVAIANVS